MQTMSASYKYMKFAQKNAHIIYMMECLTMNTVTTNIPSDSYHFVLDNVVIVAPTNMEPTTLAWASTRSLMR